MAEYYLGVDEYGQPYIAHAFWNRKGGEKKNHKYIARIKIGDRFRYFYTKKELDAYQNNKPNKADMREKEIPTLSVEHIKSEFKKKKEAAEDARAKKREEETEKFLKSMDAKIAPVATREVLKQVKKGKKLVFDSKTQSEIRVDKYVDRVLDERKNLVEEYRSSTNDKERKKLSKEIESLTDDLEYVLSFMSFDDGVIFN